MASTQSKISLSIFILIYSEISLQECITKNYNQQTKYNNSCSHREYACTDVTNEMLMRFHDTAEPCETPPYCYTMSITDSHLPQLDHQIFVTHTACSASMLYCLTLTNNNIQDLTENTFSIPSNWEIDELRELRINKNQLTAVESNVFMFLRKLLILDLSFNKITSIGNVSYNLPLLEELDLSHNKISYLKSGIFEKLTKLKSLNISMNDITYLSEDVFQKLSNLEILNLRRNNLDRIGQTTFATTRSLVRLDLADNKISSLSSESFLSLTKLYDLSLMQNDIKELPLDTFHGMPNLQSLHLGTNSISNLEIGVFSSLGKLEYLDLSSNRLSDLDAEVLLPLHNLITLDLENNILLHVDYLNIPLNLPNLKYIGVSRNNWSCSLLISMLKLFNKHNVSYALNFTKQYQNSNVDGVTCQERKIDSVNLQEHQSVTNLENLEPYLVAIIVILLFLLFSVLSVLFLKCIKYKYKKNNVKVTHMGLMDGDL